MSVAKAFATSANLGPGFDVCGLCLSSPFDLVSVEESNRFSIKNNGKYPAFDAANSPIGSIMYALNKEIGVPNKVTVTITKNIKPRSGMGSSAAESVGFLLAIDDLFELNFTKQQLVEYAAIGEQAAVGTPHYDNVTPCIHGGFTVTTINPLSIKKIEPPADLELMLLISSVEKASTAYARSVLPEVVPFRQYVRATSNIAKLIQALDEKNTEKIIRAVQLDEIIEPSRAKAGIIPLLEELRKVAQPFEIGVCSSGAGPTILALCRKGNEKKQEFKENANKLFTEKGLTLEIVDANPNNEGAVLAEKSY